MKDFLNHTFIYGLLPAFLTTRINLHSCSRQRLSSKANYKTYLSCFISICFLWVSNQWHVGSTTHYQLSYFTILNSFSLPFLHSQMKLSLLFCGSSTFHQLCLHCLPPSGHSRWWQKMRWGYNQAVIDSIHRLRPCYHSSLSLKANTRASSSNVWNTF